MAPLLEFVLEVVSEAPEALFDLLPRKVQKWGCLAVIGLAIAAVVLWVIFG